MSQKCTYIIKYIYHILKMNQKFDKNMRPPIKSCQANKDLFVEMYFFVA